MSGLPDRPDLDQLRRQARELMRAAAAGEPGAADRLGEVSSRVTLAAAQLAVAREYGFPSWTALKAEVERRRSPATLADRWSFGGAATLQTSAGVLLPETLIADASQAIMRGSLTLSGNSQPTAAATGQWLPTPRALLARLVPRRNARAIRDRRARARAGRANILALSSIAAVDNRGRRYVFRGGGSSGELGAQDRLVHLRVDPVPGRDIEWIELQAQDGITTRMLPASRAAVRIGQLRPARGTTARQSGLPDAAPRVNGPRINCDIGVALPAVDGTSIHLDSLTSLPGSWQLYLRAWPRWRNYSQAGQREKDLVSVHAEDDRGGSYLASSSRNTGHPVSEERVMEWEELLLQFLPPVDPLARALKLTFQGAHEEITVGLEIGTTQL